MGGEMAWLKHKHDNRDTTENGAEDSAAVSQRWSQVLWSDSIIEHADPDEVEARIRNLSHGTHRE